MSLLKAESYTLVFRFHSDKRINVSHLLIQVETQTIPHYTIKMKITVFSAKEFEKPYIKKANTQQHNLQLTHQLLDEDSVELANDSKAIITFPTDDLSSAVIDKLSETGVEYIASRSAGTDHIDIEYAKKAGFKLANAPGYSPHAIAEHSVGMMLCINRNLIQANRNMLEQDFSLDGLVGFDFHGKTAGIIGAGKIGAVVAKILHGFGCNILIADPKKNPELEEKYNADYTDINTLCRESDIISIHAPLTDGTKYLIDREKLELMKNDVMIINAGRGKLIKTNDLIEALKQGQIGSAGLDVYEHEKGFFFYDHKDEALTDDQFAYLLANPNVLITGHQAFTTEEALTNMNEMIIDAINTWEEGEEPENQL